MQYLMLYVNAIKNLNKKYYLIPFLILMYTSIILSGWDPWVSFIMYDDKGLMDIVIFIVSFFQVYTLMILQILFYPHANFFIQTTWLYRKIFGSTWGVVSSGLSKYANIGKDIPDDYHIRGSHGSVYTISSGSKTKRERVGDLRSLYGFYLIMKFFFKDLILRLFTHLGIFMVSPILFLIAIPILKKKELLSAIGK